MILFQPHKAAWPKCFENLLNTTIVIIAYLFSNLPTTHAHKSSCNHLTSPPTISHTPSPPHPRQQTHCLPKLPSSPADQLLPAVLNTTMATSSQINGTADYVRQLLSVVHSEKELKQKGFTVNYLEEEDFKMKQRCRKCNKRMYTHIIM